MNSKVKKVKLMQVLTAVLITTVLMLSQISCKQKTQDVEKHQTENTENIQLMPEFIGEEGDIMEYLGYNLKYPEEAIKSGVNIRVTYSFVVEKDGSVTDIKWIATHVEKDSDNPDVIAAQKACEKVAYETVESTSNQWKPAQKDNLPVRAEMSLPVWFKFH
ncbi:MAG: energy transducer TonB [Prevotellaceae bacterium]|jgi:protein TonB|nr:energy transducer TonB [Prevotellaceae bacterium]